LLILQSEVPARPCNKDKQINAHAEYEMPPNRAIPKDALWAGYTYPKGRLLPSCLGLRNFAGFQIAKTSANKRFLYYVCNPITQIATAKLQQFFESHKQKDKKTSRACVFAD
jgi:hypothetical protein